MISERSCDTEDWSNDAENTALIRGMNKKKYIYSHNCDVSEYLDVKNIKNGTVCNHSESTLLCFII